MTSKIPKCMSTQHPDNVHPPFFATHHELTGEDEVQEAYYAFSHLGCDEQMWDCEGKEIDDYVVKKLLTKYEPYFKENVIGEDIFITLRVPNPDVEKGEAKILLETLESIPRSFDSSKMFYGRDVAPIFEVILPMTASAGALNRVHNYYSNFVVGKQKQKLDNHTTVEQWIGEFKPERINVIPLVEEKEHMIGVDTIVRGYVKGKDQEYQRVFLARSDPALNYGSLSAVLLNRIALYKLDLLSKELALPIYPIIGVGSPPFRGNMQPKNVDKLMDGYPSVQTFTVQSSFKYDHHVEHVEEAISKLMSKKQLSARKADEEELIPIINKFAEEYQRSVRGLANIINIISHYVPRRRKRKLHIGLFGYSRDTAGVKLPRAIGFTAALYSIGLPPEILGVTALDDSDIAVIEKTYPNFRFDIGSAMKFYNPHCELIPEALRKKVEDLVDFDINKEHFVIANRIAEAVKKNQKDNLTEQITSAASIRQFLG